MVIELYSFIPGKDRSIFYLETTLMGRGIIAKINLMSGSNMEKNNLVAATGCQKLVQRVNSLTATIRGSGYSFFVKWSRYPGARLERYLQWCRYPGPS